MLDAVWALYARHVVSMNALPASFWAALLIVAQFIMYTEDHWLLIPAASGALVGTFVVTYAPTSRLGRVIFSRLG
jgi:hypothetical protein